jgi:asparagine synthase (glutamine-hydrolysing)
MSAIWGTIDLLNNRIKDEIADLMEKPYHKYKIDNYRRYIEKDAVIGYGGQHFTKEAEKEVLPIESLDGQQLFVTDAVLDNREELFKLMQIPKAEYDEVPDGMLMYQVFVKYGRDSLNLFRGTYSFVYYDRLKEEVWLVADITASRCLYYRYQEGRLLFSTLLGPILQVVGDKKQWNFRHLSDYLALDSLSQYTEAEETPYEGIYKLSPGQAVIISKDSVTKLEYWKPDFHTSHLVKCDDEIKNEFITLFDQCVADVMRSSGKTGISLSSGLDSTSVACFAGPKLKEKGETLYAYTSIPERDYISSEPPRYNPNEQSLVERTKEFLGNLHTTYLELNGENGFDAADEYLKMYELPYKSLQNVKWLHEIAVSAARDGCRLLLNGQFGNATISFGDYTIHFYSLLRSGNIKELIKEVSAFHKLNQVGRKQIYLTLLRICLLNVFHKQTSGEAMFATVYDNPLLIHRYNTEKRFRKSHFNQASQPLMTFKRIRPFTINNNSLVQIGEFETHRSLITGVLLRDPTRDKRLIEFCLKLPMNQFVYRGIERRLVKEYLKDYLPKEIIQARQKGIQSADLIHRLAKNWERIYIECDKLLQEEIAEQILDVKKLKKKLDILQTKLLESDRAEINKLLYSILIVKYVRIN